MEKKMKTILSFVAVALMFAVCFVSIGDGGADAAGDVAEIDGTGYSTLQAAIDAGDGRTIKILTDITDQDEITLDGGKNITIDLNDKTITFKKSNGFVVKTATLTLNGKGAVKEREPDYAPVKIHGSETSAAGKSVVTIGEGVELEGWSGVMIRQYGAGTDDVKNYNYGTVLNLNGIVVGKKDGSGTAGHGIYVNGNIVNKENSPVINIGSTADVKSMDGNGMYLAGYARCTIDGGRFTETTTAIEIRAGEMTINGGTFTSSADAFSCTANGNGPTTKGAAIAVAQHTTKLDLKVNIKGGTFTGVRAINEQNIQNNPEGDIAKVKMMINGGTFTGVINSQDVSAFVKGGSFTDIVNAVKYADSGAIIKLADNVTITESIVIPVGKTITIDLNGHDITGNITAGTKTTENTIDNTYTAAGHMIINYGELTIVGEGTIKIETTGAAAILNMENGIVDLNGGEYKTENTGGWYLLANYGEMNIYSDVTVSGVDLATSTSGPSLICTGWNDDTVQDKNVVMNIYGGTFTGGLNTVKNSSWCHLTIYGGDFSNSARSTVLNWSVVDICDGTFRQANTAAYPLIWAGYWGDSTDQRVTTIYGGTFYAAKDQPCVGVHNQSSGGYTINIYDGSFYTNGDKPCIDPTNTKSETYYIDIYGGTYSDLSGLPYVTDGVTYTLNSDCIIKSDVTLSASITLDTNGKIIGIDSGKTFKVDEGAVFTGIIVSYNDTTLENGLRANGMKAGVGGISITAGSLKINGQIIQDSGTYSGATIAVDGDSIKIEGILDAGATMEINDETTVTIEDGKEFISNGKIVNNSSIVNEGTFVNNGSINNSGSIENKSKLENVGTVINEGTLNNKTSESTILNSGSIENKDKSKIENAGTVTNTGTLKVADESNVTGPIVNNGIIDDERAAGSTAVVIDTDKSSGTGVIVTKDNADAYKDQDVKVIVEDPETSGITEGTVTVNSDTYVFIDAVTTTGDLVVTMNDQYKTYALTIPKGTVIPAGTIVSVEYLDFTSDTTKYEIKTPGITNFSVKVPVQTGFKSAKVYCDGSEQGVSNVRYNSAQGYVMFDAGHNSVFTIVLSSVAPTPSPTTTSDAVDENAAFIAATVLLVIAILALAVVIKRR